MISKDVNYIYVLDYSDETICEIKVEDGDRNKDIIELLEEKGCNINTSFFMSVEERITNIITL